MIYSLPNYFSFLPVAGIIAAAACIKIAPTINPVIVIVVIVIVVVIFVALSHSEYVSTVAA